MNHTQPMASANQSAADSLKRYQPIAWALGLTGLVLAVVAAFFNQEQFWRSYLLAYLFWLEIGLGCLGLLMVHHLVGGRWSAHIRRVLEVGSLTLPLMAVLFLPLVWGMETLYPWMDAERVAQSELIQAKSLYLNQPFFLARAVLYFAVWTTLAYLLNRWSLAEDRSGEPHLAVRMRRLSALGLILFMLTVTFAAYDWMMSLEPEWFSSIYGLLFIIGAALAGLAFAIISLHGLTKGAGASEEWVQSFNDLGNFMLGFVMIWAYFSFSQFLIIWSANISEEAVWYYHRMAGGWQNVGLLLVALQFVLPFVLLLVRGVKRRAQWLTALAVLVFVVRWLDLYWLVMPAFYPQGVHFHWLDLALLLALGGIWLAVLIQQWHGKADFPLYDPHLAEYGMTIAEPEQSG